jgi:hypothetical protein
MEKNQIDLLIKKHQLLGHSRTIYGHKYARSVRALFMEGRLELIEAVDRRNAGTCARTPNAYVPRYLNLNESDSIRTYDELCKVDLHQDLTVTLRIEDSTVSLSVRNPRPRADFHLKGDWWAISFGERSGFASLIETEFIHHAEAIRQDEVRAAELKRRREIEEALLAGTYMPPEA